MKKLHTQTRVRIVNCLIEGMGVNATYRVTAIAKLTVLNLLADLGNVCAEYLDTHVRGVKCKRVQLDEIWSFHNGKEKNIPNEIRAVKGSGNVCTWVGLDGDTKLMVSHLIGERNADCAKEFIDDLASRIYGTPQVTTDGLNLYIAPLAESFGKFVDYVQLVKMYGPPETSREAHYHSSRITECEAHRIMEYSDPAHISANDIERQNLTVCMMNRRFTHLTNTFSKKIENHMHSFALYAFHYNFVRVHKALRVTPAMAAGLSDHVWELEEMVGLLETAERKAIEAGSMKRGKYRPRLK